PYRPSLDKTYELAKSCFMNFHVSPVHPKPILLMLPWLGSRPQAIAKYCDIYFRTGFDVLIVESAVSQFLWPRWGLEYGGHVLELLESECFSQRPLLVHAFSIGGYTFGQVLVHVAKDTQRYQGLTNRIRGHIYDSLVMGSLEHMANGTYRDNNSVNVLEWPRQSLSLNPIKYFWRNLKMCVCPHPT
uniref:Si:dkey-5i3.5 n=1 Tax=Sinocyclocheilus grahami TaxID=75366 RepID=A0A672MD48_SINGR